MLAALVFDPASAGCRGCATNLWLVTDDSAGLAAVERWGVRFGLVWLAVSVGVVAVALLRASPAARRASGPTLMATLAFETAALAAYAHSWQRGFLGSQNLDQQLWVAQGVALSLLGLMALGELVRERRAHRALARVVVDLSGVAVSTRTLRDDLAVRLVDPELVLAYSVDDGARFVDAAARPVSTAVPAGRQLTALEHAGRPLAVMVHRAGALSGRDLADELVSAIHLGLEHEQLRAQALAQVEDLRASGLRLVETGDAERRRVERDLHDGAQQRLVGLSLGLRLLQARTGPSPALSDAMAELNRAIDDLRSLARGLAPLVLTDAGLAAAVRALAESRPLRVTALPTGRYSPAVESTAYVAVERASEASPASVSMTVDEATLTVHDVGHRCGAGSRRPAGPGHDPGGVATLVVVRWLVRGRPHPADRGPFPRPVALRIVAGTDFDTEIKQLLATMSTIGQVLGLDKMRAEIADLGEQVAAPDLWDDQANATRVTGRLSTLQGELDRFSDLQSRIGDLEALVELGQEVDDAASLAEAEVEPSRSRRPSRRSRSAPCCPGSTTRGRP